MPVTVAGIRASRSQGGPSEGVYEVGWQERKIDRDDREIVPGSAQRPGVDAGQGADMPRYHVGDHGKGIGRKFLGRGIAADEQFVDLRGEASYDVLDQRPAGQIDEGLVFAAKAARQAAGEYQTRGSRLLFGQLNMLVRPLKRYAIFKLYTATRALWRIMPADPAASNESIVLMVNKKNRLILSVFFWIALTVLTACGTLNNKKEQTTDAAQDDTGRGESSPSKPDETDALSEFNGTSDPLESFNRAMYKFNDVFDDVILTPVAKGYDFILPGAIKTGITNFFYNVREPLVILNNLLQGKLGQASSDTGRFLVNTTVGIAGLFDVATSMNLPKHEEDFGQTLAVWGVGSGAYVVWPFIGPRDVRDSFGWLVDWYSNPRTYIESSTTKWGLVALDMVDTRANYLGDKEILRRAAGEDVYPFVREAYRQRRLNQIYDGNPPIEDDLLFEE